MSDLLTQLSSVVGPEHVTPGTDEISAQGVRPNFVVSPASAEELADAMKIAAAARAAVIPWGGGTRQRLGTPPVALDRPVLVMRTGRMNRVLDYTPDDMTISVGAGITFDEVDQALRPNGQMLPMDVALPGRSTIGGALACVADGPRRHGYGTFRDLFLGTRVVEAGGRISKAGGMTVKNVSGFDMMKLYIGSMGSLAILTSANFKLLPIPRATATIACEFDTLEGAFAMVEAVHASKLLPAACELVSADGGVGFGLCLATDGLEQAVARHKRDLPDFARKAGANASDVLEGDEHMALWRRINDLPQTAELAPNEMVLRVTCLASRLGDSLLALQRLATEHNMRLQVSARALNGIAYVRADGDAWKKFHAAALAAVPDAFVVTLGLGTPEPSLNVWGRPPNGLEVMRRIKSEFDPGNILNPGRFIV
jgi:glycolate oxidase FAD binding subunit